ncbi:hypothetical protein N431DRAFT_554655 [Stipitochalara longipes BDJ]|nr:hypothetical protein N431DRAFT_554655 [Stipitochalara longipes BDJ]
MLLYPNLFILFLAGASQAAPAPFSTGSAPAIPPSPYTSPTKISSSVVLPQTTAAAKNSTVSASFNGSNYTDEAPSINPNATLHSLTKPEPDIIIFNHPTTCENLIATKASQLAKNVGTPTSGYISDSNWGTVHQNYKWGAIYCHDVTNGAHAVYGDIWLKWSAQNGDYGYPITDETGATDKVGTTIRFNIFSQANAIYWTAQHGAFLIYGDIYQKWLSIGDVKSSVGYPITDETGSGNYGGRFNDFTNGMIYWHAGNSWVHVGGLPSSLTWTWNPINLGDVTGSNTITISSNGDAKWVSNIHANTVLEFDWSVGWVLVDADGTAVTLYQSGTVGPNLSGLFGGPTNDNNIDTTASNSVISENWRAWVAWNYGTALGNSGVDIPFITTVINELVQIVEKVAPVIVAIISVL